MSSRQELLQAAAVEFSHDYAIVPGGEWACRLTDDLYLEVTERGAVKSSIPVRAELDLNNWPEEALQPALIGSTERDDAIESIADASDQSSSEHGTPWFYCPVHIDEPLMVCCTAWTCPQGHDVGHVGRLSEE